MKHLHFVQSLEPLQGGGLGRAATDLHLTFRSLGKESSLVSTAGRADHSAVVPESTVLPRLGPDKAFFSPRLFSTGRNAVSEADAIHAHGFYVSTNWILGRTAHHNGKALVMHPHGMFEPWILGRSRGKKRIAHWLFEDANFQNARLWRALTSQEADQIRGQGIEAPIVVAPNGVDPTPFDAREPTRSDPKKNKRTALFLGRLHPKKGVDLLIEAWATLPAKLRDEWSLIIAGPEEDGHKEKLIKIVYLHSLEDSVSFPGLVTGDAKIKLLCEADLFLLTSHSEGFSVAMLEAMAARLPVIATRACNFSELFKEGGGWECEPNIPSIFEALQSALNAGEAERMQRGETGRKLLEARYTWKSSAQTLLDACEQHCQ